MGWWPDPPAIFVAEFVPAGPVWVRPFLVRLAEALSAGPAGRGLLVEADSATPVGRLAAFPREAGPLADLAASGLPVRLREVERLSRAEPPAGLESRFGRVRPVSASTNFERGDRESRIPATFAPKSNAPAQGGSPLHDLPTDRLPGTGWAAWQLHLLGLGGPRVSAELRFCVAGTSANVRGIAEGVGAALAFEVRRRGPVAATFEALATTRALRGEWGSGSRPSADRRTSFLWTPDEVPKLPWWGGAASPSEPSHEFVIGASGAGKTSYLAGVGAAQIERGRPVVAFDVHGDLAPAIASAIPPAFRERVAALDAADRSLVAPGVAVLGRAEDGEEDREAAHLVAALKRLTADGPELYWGFRIERTFDAFVRVVQDERGGLTDLYRLLTDARRREAARFACRRPEVGAFLEELTPLLQRNPELLWPAAARVAKVVLHPRLGRLLDPGDGAVPVDAWLSSGRSILFRLPIGELGPEGSQFAATLLASRLYLSRVARTGPGGARSTVTFLFDEAHVVSPRVLAEILSEGRKFGVAALVATQYPDRLAPELRAAAAGAVGTHLVFRIPRAMARSAGGWVGLGPESAGELLPNLPTGTAVRASSGPTDERILVVARRLPWSGEGAWAAIVESTHRAFGTARAPVLASDRDALDEAILLAAFGAHARGAPIRRDEIPRELPSDARALWEDATVVDRVERLRQIGYVQEDDLGVRPTIAGERFLGLTTRTGAARESSEHRALLLAAFRILAARGCAMEIVRQGRFDVRLPDGRITWVSRGLRHAPSSALAAYIDRLRTSWGFRYFRGRDVHVEAEVSGAGRRDRVARGLAKAGDRDAFVLFLVTQAGAARRIRAVLREEGVYPDRALVWTLPKARVPPRKG